MNLISVMVRWTTAAALLGAVIMGAQAGGAWAQGDRAFDAVVTDSAGLETEVKNIYFYWEEKLSETTFVPHEMKEVPVKRGTATVKVKFDIIKQIDVRPSSDNGPPVMSITLTSGKTGEFGLAIPGRFRGESDFGEVEYTASGLSKIVFK